MAAIPCLLFTELPVEQQEFMVGEALKDGYADVARWVVDKLCKKCIDAQMTERTHSNRVHCQHMLEAARPGTILHVEQDLLNEVH
jgi:hypothetical protein